MTEAPLRTWLFTPGMDARKINKALASASDAIILDLEDAVAISAKPEARRMVRSALNSAAAERNIYVRVNDITTGMTIEDIRAVCVGGIAGIVLPKAESAETVRLASQVIDACCVAEGVPPNQVRICAIIESAKGVINAAAVADAGARLSTMMFGAGDFTNDMAIPTANTGLHLANGKIQTALACRAAGLSPPVDTVFFDVTDEQGFETDCLQAKALGFQGKAVIHPTQIGVANAIFSPSAAEIAAAREVVDRFTEAEARGVGAIRVEGKLVDYAMIKNAEKLLAKAAALRLV